MLSHYTHIHRTAETLRNFDKPATTQAQLISSVIWQTVPNFPCATGGVHAIDLAANIYQSAVL
jgi:hypothetical protein